MDRSELIKALGAAFTEEDKTTHVKVESAIAGDKKVLRLSAVHENSATFEIMRTHPDCYLITDIIDRLVNCNEKIAIDAGQELKFKFEKAAENGSDEKIEEMIKISKEIHDKMLGTAPDSPQRAIVYMMASNSVKKL